MNSNTNGVDVSGNMDMDPESPVTAMMSLSWNGHRNAVNGNGFSEMEKATVNGRRSSSSNSA